LPAVIERFSHAKEASHVPAAAGDDPDVAALRDWITALFAVG
jgi:hypothetical protein